MKLGKLKEIDIRSVWAHEQYNFSKWLANDENIKELGDELNLSLTDVETEKFVGKIQLRPRLDNETDKDYFERVTGCNWQKYDYEPDSINEAIYDNNLSRLL